ncbi:MULTISPECIES: MerR family transcriptional regulator [unclassified Saccharothrix]|uniref:MerR family transcriptional regulator n=1 Tax=unclassified Saccharothrix TaxID=2593673 RepID=UPI00307D03D3
MLWSAGAVARMLGISPTTLRTWDRRYGLGPSSREEGKHRRYSEDDVSRLRRMLALTGRGVVPAAAAAIALGRTLDVEPHAEPRVELDVEPHVEPHVEPEVEPHAEPDDTSPAGREVSGGRRTRLGSGPAESAQRARAGGEEAGPDDGAGVRGWLPEARGFARAAYRLDLPLMTDLAGGLVARHGVVRAWERVLVPFLVALGEKVAAQGSGVEVEHLATTAVLEAVRGQVLPVSGRLPALLACAPDEQHSLPLNVLGAALAERGCSTRHLGARVPAAALLDAVKLLEPRVVVLWAHAPGYAGLAPVNDLLERGREVLLGGPGWAVVPPGARRVGSLSEAVDTVLDLNRF